MVYESYVSRAFLNDCNKCQDIKVFNALYSSIDSSIEEITQEKFHSALVGAEGNYIGPVLTYIKDDSLIVKIRDANIRNYSIVYFMYGKKIDGNWDDGRNLAFAIRIQDEHATELEDFTDNYITFDMKDFDLACTFLTFERDTAVKYPVMHEHKTSSIDSNDNNPLIDILDLNQKIFNKLNQTLELHNPTDLQVLGANRLIIEPNAKVMDADNNYALNISGEDFINNDVNLAIVNDDSIVENDILF